MRTSCARVVSRSDQWLFRLSTEHLAVPARAHDLRQATGIVAVGLVPGRKASAALTCRASRQTTGRPSFRSSCQCQADKGPLSRPMRTASGALVRMVAAIASGVEVPLALPDHLGLSKVFPGTICKGVALC